MATKPKTWDETLFEGLIPHHGKEFMLPNILNPWLLEEFVVIPHLRLKAYPTRICDDSTLYKTLTKPSVPLAASVEEFFLGDSNDNPLRLQPHRMYDTESGIFPGSRHFENVQSYVGASRTDLTVAANHPSSVDKLAVINSVQ